MNKFPFKPNPPYIPDPYVIPQQKEKSDKMKTPEEMAEEYCNTKQLSYVERLVITKGFIDGYKAAQQRKWISVKDHYPWPSNDDCDPKLVAIKAAGGYVFDVADTAHGCRWADKLGENVEHEYHEVTHWMPLPEPPKEEK